MMRKRPKSASRKWSVGLSTPEASPEAVFRLPGTPSKMVAFTPIRRHLGNVGSIGDTSR